MLHKGKHMEIPKSFTLANRTWTVSVLSPKKFEKKFPGRPNLVGHTDVATTEIVLLKEVGTRADYIYHIYWHEVFHALMIMHGDGSIKEHNNTEVFVDGMSALLIQYEQTKKGSIKL